MIRKTEWERAADKMKSQNGASLFLALMFFLICALAGSAILSIAQTYEKRVREKSKDESGYLAVLSAAEFLKGQLRLCEGEWNLDSSGMNIDEETENRVQKELLETLHEFCKTYINHPAKAEKEIYLRISLEDNSAGDLNENQMIPDMEVRIIFQPGEEAEEWFEEDLEENLDGSLEEDSEEIKEYKVPISLKAVFSIEGKRDNTMSLSAAGVVIYEAEEMMEVYWEEFLMEKLYD